MLSSESRSNYIIGTVNLVKKFGKVIALRGVNFRVGYNEVVGLVGDNGAGKSTLVKTLFGVYPPTSGYIIIKGRKFRRLTPELAYKLGIVLVHQERTLAFSHSIWRNVYMGRELTGRFGFLRIKEMKEGAAKALNGLGLKELPPDMPVMNLSGGYRQGVQISRALTFEADVVILDEPTIQLSLSEVQKVLEYVRSLRRRGKSAVFISHNIYHVYPVADRFVILERGQIIGEFYKKDVTPEEVSEIMIYIASSGKFPPKYKDINLISS